MYYMGYDIDSHPVNTPTCVSYAACVEISCMYMYFEGIIVYRRRRYSALYASMGVWKISTSSWSTYQPRLETKARHLSYFSGILQYLRPRETNTTDLAVLKSRISG